MKFNGFTLIELLVTVSVIAIAMISVTGVLVSVTKVQQKQSALINIQSSGADVISVIEHIIRGSRSISVDNGYKRLVYYDNNGNRKYIGLAIDTSGCSPVGFIYNSATDLVSSPLSIIPDYERATNSNDVNGVNIKNLFFEKKGTNPTWIVVTIDIEKAPCSNTFSSKLSTSFTTTVRSLR